ncbi:uncharacterized protein PFL1_05274 [Pseudozyma flocculosa PF-1]|uniref:UBA domain-containing protein n=1 Tax=Pseudozyma flocculosa PF-1 TaxID=1277687 RepID=A0A061H447_9BASI|nr:uncharacterized protein PFL1_05274 [Pseudozyma flocculosa PF-1]EPQ27353.1 hypothetical protein PFL1_05274 [Pseudozyma flocculosa PF-1]
MDDLLDLDWKQAMGTAGGGRPPASSSSSAANTSTGSSIAARNGVASTSSYNFDSLTRSLHAASPAPPPPRAAASHQPQRTATPSSSAAAPSAPTSSSSSSQDAFSSLLSFGGAASSGGVGGGDFRSSSRDGNLTLAERQMRAQQEAKQRASAQQHGLSQSNAAWAGLDSDWDSFEKSGASSTPFAKPPSAAAKPAQPAKASAPSSDPWDFDSFADPLPQQAASSESSTSTRRPPPSAAAAPADPFDFDAFDGPDAAATGTQQQQTPSFGHDPEAGIADDDEDILGALGKPVDRQSRSGPGATLHPTRGHAQPASRASTTTSSSVSSRQPSPASGSRTTYPRSVSPPPHILGQIVEMGFSPQDARKALARTESGLDVEAALELLRRADERLAEELQRQESARYRGDGGFDGGEEDPDLAAYEAREAERRRRRRAGPSRGDAVGTEAGINAGLGPNGLRAPSRNATPSSQAGSAEWQQQADQLYAQASELGANMLGKATAFWSSAKAQAQKALEEHQKAAGADAERRSSPAGSARRWGLGGGGAAAKKEWEGKPKWMVDAEAAAEDDSAAAAAAAGGSAAGGFKDSDDEGEGPAPAAAKAPPVPRRPKQTTRDSAAAESPSVNLWDDADAPGAPGVPAAAPAAPPSSAGLAAPAGDGGRRPYVSPNRRGPSRTSAAAAAPAAATATARDKAHRSIPADDASAVAAASRHKNEGNEQFKKGAYGDAEASYTRGVDALSSASLRLVPLLNNRANARLKNGSAAAAVEDCERVLALIHPGGGGGGASSFYRPSAEHALPGEVARDVNLRDGYAKALLRKAQASEALEKWGAADETWQLLLEYEKQEGSGGGGGGVGGAGGVNNLRFARDGIARCGKMLGRRANANLSSSVGGTSRSRPPRVAAGSSATTTATTKLREHQRQTAAQEAEEAERLSHKDDVDAQLSAWRAGKETNLRALLASVDALAWPSLGWNKVGMHQLVTDAQVKRAYVRAIAKVHPDKLTPSNTTVQQRMLAAGIFNGLNEAWNASVAK